MKKYILTEAELKIADIIWDNEPVFSAELVKLCETELNWEKSTTYTMLKKLETKGVFINKKGTVESLLNREEFYAKRSEQMINEGFDGSLPRFLAAFTREKQLSDDDIREIQRLIDEHKEV